MSSTSAFSSVRKESCYKSVEKYESHHGQAGWNGLSRRKQRDAKIRYKIFFVSILAVLVFVLHHHGMWHWLALFRHRIAAYVYRVFGCGTQTHLDPSSDNGSTPILTSPFAFKPLPLGSVKPLGWIKDQMNLMSVGLAGYQYEFYHIVRNSPWLGGNSEYSVLNEGLPYWFNGLVPLAYALNNTRLIQQVEDASDIVLNHQKSDGWLGPEAKQDRDIWARFPFCLGLIQLVEGDPTRAEKIVPAMYRFVERMHLMLIEGTGFDQIWGRVRFSDMLITLQWLYEHFPEGKEQLLLETMYLLRYRGMDWTEYWQEGNFIKRNLDLEWPPITDQSSVFPFVHGVNAVQGLKAGAALNRFLFNDDLVQLTRQAVNWTLKYHGDPAGSVIGDEREAGVASNRGTELCTTVELMYSLSYLYQTIGDNYFADRCELATFNALPVSITKNHWQRQYLAVANEPFADICQNPTPFWNVGADGLIYGLERNYPCCTVNMPQGLPKFLSASFVRTGENGIGHALLGPAEVSTVTAQGTQVKISCDTLYPFAHALNYTINSSAPFAFHVRVPSWYLPDQSSIEINNNGVSYPLEPDPQTGMAHIALPAGLNRVNYKLGAKLRVEPRANGSVSIYHGALLYALDIGQTVTNLPVHLFNETFTYPEVDGRPNIPSHLHDVAYGNTKPWNIAIDPSTLEFHPSPGNATVEKLDNPIFDYEAPPSYITGKGCEIHWELFNGLPAPMPELPPGAVWQCQSNVTDIVLRPYGSLKIHMAELPTVDLQGTNTTAPKASQQKPGWADRKHGKGHHFEM